MNNAPSVNRIAVNSGIALLTRQVIVQGLNITTGILLARWLEPAGFGIYGTMAFLLNFLIAVGDVGLGASLIRQSQEPSIMEYRSVFTFQQCIAILLAIMVYIVAPIAKNFFNLSDEYVWLFRGLGLAILATSFQTLPSIKLERRLEFSKLAVMEIIQSVVYNAILICGALLNWGLLMFAMALILRSLSGAIYINLRHPWSFGWAFNWSILRQHLSFGLPYQGVGIISLVKDSVTPVLIGGLIGLQAVGYANWAQTFAGYPVMALMMLQRVYLPTFARLQNDTQGVKNALNNVLFFTNGVTSTLAIVTLCLSHYLINFVFGDKWSVAAPIFYILWLGNIFVATSTPLFSFLNAIGKSNITFRFALLWFVLTWILGVPLINVYGLIGFALANFIVQLSNIVLFVMVWKLIRFDVVNSIAYPWIFSSMSGFIVFVLSEFFPPNGLWNTLLYAFLICMISASCLVFLSHKGRSIANKLFTWRF